MITDFYIDESGNTGDLCKVGAHPSFGAQRFFGMACIGVADTKELEAEVSRLRSAHRLQGNELKSTNLTTRPKVAGDLARFLIAKDWPVFIEAVDKHYMIMTTIMDRLIMPPIGPFDYSAEGQLLRNTMADYLAVYGPDAIGGLYAKACATQKRPDLREVFKAIIAWAKVSQREPSVARVLERATRKSLKEFEKRHPLNSVADALPIPDRTKSDTIAWLLPNIPSFASIYARVNRYAEGRIGNVTFTHDEQTHFDDILDLNKSLAESFKKHAEVFNYDRADYNFRETSNLQFRRSHDAVGIQVADVLVGFVTRYIYQRVWTPEEVHADQHETFEIMKDLQGNGRATGINYVAPDQLLQFMGMIPDPNYRTRSSEF